MSVPEQWLPIPGYEGYEASSLGRIRSCWVRGGAHDRGRRLGQSWRLLERGHPFDEANTYVLPGSGSRVCRACVKDRRQRVAV